MVVIVSALMFISMSPIPIKIMIITSAMVLVVLRRQCQGHFLVFYTMSIRN